MTNMVDFSLVAEKYNLAERRLLMLDYDGTLVPFFEDPELARPDNRLSNILARLNADKRNEVVIISGRRKEDMESFFDEIGMTLVAEHGGFYKLPSADWRQTFLRPDWIVPVSRAVKALTVQYEGSLLEEKYYSVAWHYRAIASTFSLEEKRKVLDALHGLSDFGKFMIDENHCTIEFRTPLIGKGLFLDMRNDGEYSFKMALGDGRTDEDLFRKMGDDDFSIRIGESSDSVARFHLASQHEVLPFLAKLLAANEAYESMRQSVGLSRQQS